MTPTLWPRLIWIAAGRLKGIKMLGHGPLATSPLASLPISEINNVEINYYNGAIWVASPLKIYRNGSWEAVTKTEIKRWDGSQWTALG